ncbi:MAG: hypothetical protein JO149_08510 [Gammaproteobacteria bacterium]|nr:hypothetical protein [Gammaproteobacteria bacterium]
MKNKNLGLALSAYFFATILSLMSGVIYAQTHNILTVVEENADYVSFYDTASFKKLASIKVGYLPHEITITKDGKIAFVTNFGIKDYDGGIGSQALVFLSLIFQLTLKNIVYIHLAHLL